MALDKVLSSANGAGSHIRHLSEPEEPNKRPKTNLGDSKRDENKPFRFAQHRNVLPRPLHTVSSQSQSQSHLQFPTSASLSKRLAKHGKNTRNLTIFPPAYTDQHALGIRSAPLNSGFRQQQQQQQQQQPQQPQQQQPHTAYFHPPQQPPSTAGRSNGSTLLQPGHTLAPLLSPRAPVRFHKDADKGFPPSPRKQEFAIPPIVPSQQQPTHHSATFQHQSQPQQAQQYVSSPSLYGYQGKSSSGPGSGPGTGSGSGPGTGSGSGSGSTSGSGSGSTSALLPTTAAAVPLPPQTPTTTTFAALQRQQFLQPFEHLFDTIETTRTLKTTLDDQIRRSSSLMQTLQASSTTIEGLIRNQIKEAHKETTARFHDTINDILKRLDALENTNAPNTSEPPTHSSTAPIPSSPLSTSTAEPMAESSSEPNPHIHLHTHTHAHVPEPTTPAKINRDHLRSPPTIVRSQNEIGPDEYQNMLNALRERLDRLERQLEV
ncbi:hypothetical protein CLU79DRAFT_717930 [Phycomyces nitens]|nr:hypothetical protein CLU79DRAFT_717930 [Phycomyces nitens]